MKTSIQRLTISWLARWIVLAVLAWTSVAGANPVDKSDMNNDGIVDVLDLAIFSQTYLEQDWLSVDWCQFYEASIASDKYFRKQTSENIDRFKLLMEFIAIYFDCDGSMGSPDKSDLNGDSQVDLQDLIIFSTNYLEQNWTGVDWCLFYENTLAGQPFDGRSTDYYLLHFVDLLSFINIEFECSGPPPPPIAIQLENQPVGLYRIAHAAFTTGDYYITDPRVGSLFIYDSDRVLKGEIKGLDKPLGVAVDGQGHVLIGNSGRNNIEVFDPANGDLLAVFGEGLIKMPNDISVDELGYIYVTDSRLHTVVVFDANYNLVRGIGRPGDSASELHFPVDAEIVGSSIFVADQGHTRIQVYDLYGTWVRSITFLGTPDTDCYYDWQLWTEVCLTPGLPEFKRIQALATDASGRLHVIDKLSATAMIFNPVTGAYISSYGEYGTGPLQLQVPTDVHILPTNEAMVTAGFGGRIEIFPVQ
jgi:hypothetical protein